MKFSWAFILWFCHSSTFPSCAETVTVIIVETGGNLLQRRERTKLKRSKRPSNFGDFNVRVGADHDSWPRSIGHFGVGKLNESGQRLLELCSYHDFCITNTYFSTKRYHKVSRCHPRSHHWHQLDLVITQRTLLLPQYPQLPHC